MAGPIAAALEAGAPPRPAAVPAALFPLWTPAMAGACVLLVVRDVLRRTASPPPHHLPVSPAPRPRRPPVALCRAAEMAPDAAGAPAFEDPEGRVSALLPGAAAHRDMHSPIDAAAAAPAPAGVVWKRYAALCPPEARAPAPPVVYEGAAPPEPPLSAEPLPIVLVLPAPEAPPLPVYARARIWKHGYGNVHFACSAPLSGHMERVCAGAGTSRRR